MKRKLIVASNSARRQALMKDAGYSFEVQVIDVDEHIPDGMSPTDVARHLAEFKNKAYRAVFKEEIIMTADTIVICEGEILGKPKDEKEAFEMLSSLSGKSHQVMTGVCISSDQKVASFEDTTTVEFSNLTPEMIHYYIKNYQPFDKAGSYGIQEWLGMVGVKSIQGSFYNVMGLPMDKIFHQLEATFGINPLVG